MKMTKTFKKRILSVVLATMLVLSLTLVSVSAVPAEYEVLATETHGFESGNDGISVEGNSCTLERSTEKVHTGSYSMAITCANDSNYSRVWFNPTTAFTPGSKYYLSYWFYSDSWGGRHLTNPGNLTVSGRATSSNTTGQWNKAWSTIECSSEQTWIQLGFYDNMPSGTVVYIDDLEVVKVTDLTLKNNEVPGGAVAVQTLTKNFETDSNGLGADTSSIAVDSSVAHWGNKSLRAYNTLEEKGITAFYFNNKKEIESLKADTYYYLSFYVYSPTQAFPIIVSTIAGQQIVPANTIVPKGQWTKFSKIFAVNASTAGNVNSHLLKFILSNVTKDTPVYFDDIVFAELESEPMIAFTQSNIDFYDNGDALVTLTSSMELKGVDYTKITGATVTSATLASDAKTVTLELSGLEASSNYTLSFADLSDVYGRTMTVEATVSTPSADEAYMSISSASISDGETGVLAPVSYLYVAADYDLEESTVTTENITLTGGAEITNVSLYNAKTILVEIDGTLPDTAYELAIDNVENTSGGILKDTLSWTTGAAEKSGKIGFEGSSADGLTGSTNITVAGVSTEQKNSGSKSAKLVAANSGNVNWNAWNIDYMVGGSRQDFEVGKEYLVSFSVYADKGIKVGLMKHNGSNFIGMTSVSAGNWVTFTAIFKPTASNQVVNDLFFFTVHVTQTASATNIYLDDLEIKTLGNISNPCLFRGDVPVSGVGAGTTQLTIPVNGDATAIQGYAAQYDENGKMLRVAMGTSTENTVNITIEDGEEAKTKVFLWDSETDAPSNFVFKYNY